ncbi:MAG: lipase family protein [Oligoflexales bacterium]|nr:lipase family protein [Oligoflexales bacterium]
MNKKFFSELLFPVLLLNFTSQVFATGQNSETFAIECQGKTYNPPQYAFDPMAGYSISNFEIPLWMVWASEGKRDITKGLLKKWGFENTILFGKGLYGSQGLLSSHRDYDILVFRGTQNAEEYFWDSLIMPAKTKYKNLNGKVHSGIYRHFNNLLPEIERAFLVIDKDHSPDRPLIVAGHSMGGALAILATLHFSIMKKNIMALYTSAQVKVGDRTFMNEFSGIFMGKYYRIEHITDIVPNLAPSAQLAEKFSRILPAKQLRPVIEKAVKKLDYGPQTGELWQISAEGLTYMGYNNSFEIESRYWDDWPEPGRNGEDPYLGTAREVKKRTRNHSPTQYLCEAYQSIFPEPHSP